MPITRGLSPLKTRVDRHDRPLRVSPLLLNHRLVVIGVKIIRIDGDGLVEKINGFVVLPGLGVFKGQAVQTEWILGIGFEQE